MWTFGLGLYQILSKILNLGNDKSFFYDRCIDALIEIDKDWFSTQFFLRHPVGDSREGLDLEEEEEKLLKRAIALSLEGADKNDDEEEDNNEKDTEEYGEGED